MQSPAPERAIDIERIDQNGATTPHPDNVMPPEPVPAGFLGVAGRGGDEVQLDDELLDADPVAQIARAMRDVERAQCLLRRRCARLQRLVHEATCAQSRICRATDSPVNRR